MLAAERECAIVSLETKLSVLPGVKCCGKRMLGWEDAPREKGVAMLGDVDCISAEWIG